MFKVGTYEYDRGGEKEEGREGGREKFEWNKKMTEKGKGQERKGRGGKKRSVKLRTATGKGTGEKPAENRAQ